MNWFFGSAVALVSFVACTPTPEVPPESGDTAMVDFAPFLKARDTIGARVELPGSDQAAKGKIVFYDRGEGPPIVLFPSAGRDTSDFNELADVLVANGYRTLLVQPPHIDGAIASARNPSLFDLAKDVEPILSELREPVILIGHAFGNRVARATSTQYPQHTTAVILIAAGAERPVPEAANKALYKAFNPALPLAERKAAIRYAFFTDSNNVPDHWLRGWHSKTAQLQGATKQNSPSDEWRAGGRAPMLVIAGLQDRVAPPQDTIDLLERDYPDRVTGVRIDGAGHAMLPEKSDEIADAILDWLDTLPEMDPD